VKGPIPPAVQRQLDEGKFCPIPFLQLELTPLGKVSACCYSGEYEVGNVDRQTLVEIWNSEKLRRWRREFLTGDVRICKAPMEVFGCQKNYQHLNELVELAEFQAELPRRLDLRLNGKCNLECVMCDVWSQPNGLYDKSDLWEVGPERIFPFLKEVDMLGGEPFIQRDTFRFIEEVQRVNPDCTWGFITNAHYRMSPYLQGILEPLKLRHIHLSLDAVTKDTYAKVRLKGDWTRVHETVLAFVELRNRRAQEGRGFALFASMCVQRGNWFELPDFFAYCERHNLQPIIQEVIGREHLSLQGLSTDEKAELRRLYQRIPARWSGHYSFLLQGLGA
jgi:cyclic pyranopterin phosphate synthase